MKKFLAISAILTLGGLTLAGCPAKDAAQDAGNAVGNAAGGAMSATKDAAGAAKDAAAGAAGAVKDGAMGAAGAAKDAAAGAAGAAKDAAGAAVAGAGAALDSAKIKTAILAEASLKDAKIDVDVKDKTVMLKGSVKNNDLKKKAGELATAAAPGATVKNMLLVK